MTGQSNTAFKLQYAIDKVDLRRFDSPIEESFYYAIAGCLGGGTEIQNQYPAPVQGYNFVIDFVVTSGTQKIAFECDGKQYHSFEKDEWRDRLILNTGIVDAIVRIRGSDIHFRSTDVLFVLATWYPQLFKSRSRDHLEVLATDTARRSEIGAYDAYFNYDENDVQNEELDNDEPIDDKYSKGFGLLYICRKLRC